MAAPKTSGAYPRLLGVEIIEETDAGVVLALDAGADERDGGTLHGGVAMAGSVARTLEPPRNSLRSPALGSSGSAPQGP